MILNYRSTYFKAATQSQIPDSVAKNVTNMLIKYPFVRFTYLKKDEEGKWRQHDGIVRIRKINQPGYSTLKYLQALTQGKVKNEVLKSIETIHIAKNTLIFSYRTDGVFLNGRVRLEGM